MAKRDDINLRRFCENYRRGEYDSPDFDTQVRAGWYDWFCKEKTLQSRLKRIWRILKGITNDLLLDNYYVWFKNNCPVIGPLYDDIRFEPLDENERDQKYFVVTIDDKRETDKYCVYTARNRYEKEAGFQKLSEIVDFLNHWDPDMVMEEKL